jgi:hypothetical protein
MPRIQFKFYLKMKNISMGPKPGYITMMDPVPRTEKEIKFS